MRNTTTDTYQKLNHHSGTSERKYSTSRTVFSTIYHHSIGRFTELESNTIHRESVYTFMHFLPVNGALGVKPLPIAGGFKRPCVIHTQLRYGYCSRLNNYLSRLYPNLTQATTCSLEANQSFCMPLSLWSETIERARFLSR